MNPTTDNDNLRLGSSKTAILIAADAYEARSERAKLAEDVQTAEGQIAAGERLAHRKALAAVVSRLRLPG